MSNLSIFLLGVVVTALVAAAITPLIWAAILDGRYDRQMRQERSAS